MPLLASLLDVLFPPRCAACGELLEPVEHASTPLELCAVCEVTLEPIDSACERCGVPLASEGTAVCPDCLAVPPPFDGARSLYLYGAAIAEILHQYKYSDRPEYAGPLAEQLAALDVPPCDVVAPVPLHRSRRRSRTYDQALYLAQALAARNGVPCERALVVRTRATARQVGQHREERVLNVAGAFAVNGNAEGRRVLLVDDVVTTGATAAECAQALKDAGAASVWVVSVARAA